MLLIQPLKIDDINIVIKDMDDDEDDQPLLLQQQQPAQFSVQSLPQDRSLSLPHSYSSSLSPIDFIDDDELLAILGLPPSVSTGSATSNTVHALSLLDWDNTPELSESEEEYFIELQLTTNKRKFDQDVFAQEANLFTKKNCKQQLQQNPCIYPY